MLWRQILRRLAIGVPVVLGATILNFILVNAAPGSPLNSLVDPEAGPAVRKQMAERLGLDRPLPVQYGSWLWNALHGNLGFSYENNRPVLDNILERLPATLLLAGTAMVLAYLVGIAIGVVAALRPYGRIDAASSVVGVLGISIPSFILGLLLIYVFALKLHILPAGGMQTLGATGNGGLLQHLVLPVVSLAIFDLAIVTRYTRASMLEVLTEDFIRTANGKGLSALRVVVRHALRNALTPLVTLAGLSLPSLFGGAVVVEVVFQWPGMGQLAVNSVLARDYPTLLGLSLVFSVLVVVGNLIADICYTLLNPKVRDE
ncbi:MAG TPA: ABC transporter permease [Gryllotalpicola sp.]